MFISKGDQPFFEDELTVATFFPKRIVSYVETAEDLDSLKISYKIEVHHFACLSWFTYRKLLVWDVSAPDWIPLYIEEFNDQVYFHPNVHTDGWDIVWAKYAQLHEKDPDFPRCPPEPRFWQHGVSGSTIFRWPPYFFQEWVKLIAEGGTLALDLAPSAIAGPSGTSHTPAPTTPHSTGPSSSHHFSPPSSLSTLSSGD
jgi:hypothetical protein